MTQIKHFSKFFFCSSFSPPPCKYTPGHNQGNMQGVIAATRKGAGAGTAHNEQLNKNKNANISQMRAPIDDILTSNARKFNFAHFKTQQPYTQSKFYGTKKIKM